MLRKIISIAVVLGSVCITDAYAAAPKQYNAKYKEGLQFGFGVPLVTPLTGYNVFVGYVNKNASTFLGRRFGWRADFTIPSNLRLNAQMNDNHNDGYDLDLQGKILGMNVELSDFTNKKFTVDYETDDAGQNIEINGLNAELTLKNKNMGLLVDFYPFGNTWFLGGIRLSGGYYIGNLGIDAAVNVNKDIGFRYEVYDGQHDYLYAEIAKNSKFGASFNWKYHGPYAGLGFDLGIFRGFKFYMDAGVVFSNAPKVTNNNIKDKDIVIRGCYEINGGHCSTQEMTTILNGMDNKPNVDEIVQSAVGSAAHQLLSDKQAEYQGVIDALPADIGSINASDLGTDIVNYLNGDSTAPWINELLNNYGNEDLANTLENIKDDWKTNAQDATSGIQKDIDDIWADYDKDKKDALDDINDFLQKYNMVPMIKIGFMYRF